MTLPAPVPDPRPDPLPVEPVVGRLAASVRVPGSKSITNRALICAALAGGRSTLTGALQADDTRAMVTVLGSLGIDVDDTAHPTLVVEGCGGAVPGASGVLDTRQSGTTARFSLPLLLLGRGSYRVESHEQMALRPMATTFDALAELGATVTTVGRAGHLPVVVDAPTALGSRPATVQLPGDVSSQFLSGLLLVAPCLPAGLTVELTTDLVSRPYVELTVAVMRSFGADVDTSTPSRFRVSPTGYRPTRYAVEPDASAASYPWAAAAICGGSVEVVGLGEHALQGDTRFADVLAALGATVERSAGRTRVSAEPGQLRGGRFDLGDISDTAQTLAAVAPFAQASTTITGIGFIRRKEIDRVAAVATELRRCGVAVEVDDDGWTIHPGAIVPAVVETYDDHRMAMSFALLGLAVPGIEIAGPDCVAKTFPGYWDLLDQLRAAAVGQ